MRIHGMAILSIFFLLASLCSCSISRPSSTLLYSPPEIDAKVEQESVMLNASRSQVEKSALLFISQAFLGKAEVKKVDGNIVFTVALRDVASFVDCGKLSVHTPSARQEPFVFSGSQRTASFPLADGSTVAKPAGRALTADLETTITLAGQGKSTRVSVSTRYTLHTRADYYKMTSGFSPMMPYQTSNIAGIKEDIVFTTGETGHGVRQTPETYNVKGKWPVECVSTGVFERSILSGIRSGLH